MQAKKEFWNSLLTEKSWEVLQELRKEHDFILIGGWAVYLLTEQQKSKDIDIVVGIKELEKFKQKGIVKNERLRKYELKNEEVDVDIYVEHYSALALPAEDMKDYALAVQGFKAACPEALIILKQAAYKDRENSVKGEKDKIDIISILFFTEFGFKKYKKIIEKYELEYYRGELKRAVSNFKDYNALNLTPREFKLKKEKVLLGIR
jgi:hypothetical protein